MSNSRTFSKSALLLLNSILLFLVACDFSAQKSPEMHIANAREFIAKNELSAGVIELKNALQIDSNLPEARWLLGKIYLQNGNGAAAFKELSQAQSLGYTDPELDTFLLQAMLLQGRNQDILDKTYTDASMSAETLRLRGNAYLGLRELNKAESTFNELLSLEENSVAARKGLIQIAIYKNAFPNAEKLIAETLTFALEDPEVWILQGQIALLQNRSADAEKSFSKALIYNEKHTAAQFGLIRAYLLQEKTEEARATIAEIDSQRPNHPQSKYYSAFISLNEKDTDTAKTLLQEVLSVIPDHAESLLLLSRIHYDATELVQAETYISKFLSNFPEHLPALKLLSVIQLQLKQPKASVETLNNAASQVQGDWQVLALLGSALLESGDLEQGVKLLEEATQINPNTASIHTQLAIGHLAAGSIDSAITELESAIELDPDLVRADILLILAHLQAKETNAAIKAAKNFTAKHPDNPLSFNLLGAGFMLRGKLGVEDAKKQFEKAIEIKPDFTPAIANLARLDILNQDTRAAEEKLRKILGIDENNLDALETLAAIEFQRANMVKAEALLSKARETNPTALKPRLQLGAFYLNGNKTEKLTEIVDEAINLAPEHPDVLMLLGQSQRMNGNIQESLTTFAELKQKLPEAENVVFQHALTMLVAGKTDQAEKSLQEILAKNDKHMGALIASAKIAITKKEYSKAQEFAVILRKSGLDLSEAESFALEGDINIARNKPADAAQSYEKALGIAESSALILKIANAYKLAENEEKSLSTLMNWLNQHPDDVSVNLYLASHYQEQKTSDQQAIKNYEKTLELDPSNVIALNNLAWLYIESNPVRALELARSAHKLLPQSPEIMDTLGWVLITQEKIEEGLTYLGPARKGAPQLPGIRYRYAEALNAAGDKKLAKAEVDTLLSEFDERKDAVILQSNLQ
ncbi:MAG: PEP-CTERM system TPR-repeat protein PrsT [Gammaproteobacteria bacterium]|nr:PEP-CTERM system TPR-repeat protein PrsT [Gammaproteobacteria bacterium]